MAGQANVAQPTAERALDSFDNIVQSFANEPCLLLIFLTLVVCTIIIMFNNRHNLKLTQLHLAQNKQVRGE